MHSELDNLAKEVEVALRQLRRLAADAPVLSEEQVARVEALVGQLHATLAEAEALRDALLGREEAQTIGERTGGWRGGAESGAGVTVDDLFGETASEPIAQEDLPFDVDLAALFPTQLPCFVDAPERLFFAEDAQGRPVLVNDERSFGNELPPEQQVLVLTFATDTDRQAYFDRVWNAAQDECEEAVAPARNP